MFRGLLFNGLSYLGRLFEPHDAGAPPPIAVEIASYDFAVTTAAAALSLSAAGADFDS